MFPWECRFHGEYLLRPDEPCQYLLCTSSSGAGGGGGGGCHGRGAVRMPCPQVYMTFFRFVPSECRFHGQYLLHPDEPCQYLLCTSSIGGWGAVRIPCPQFYMTFPLCSPESAVSMASTCCAQTSHASTFCAHLVLVVGGGGGWGWCHGGGAVWMPCPQVYMTFPVCSHQSAVSMVSTCCTQTSHASTFCVPLVLVVGELHRCPALPGWQPNLEPTSTATPAGQMRQLVQVCSSNFSSVLLSPRSIFFQNTRPLNCPSGRDMGINHILKSIDIYLKIFSWPVSCVCMPQLALTLILVPSERNTNG